MSKELTKIMQLEAKVATLEQQFIKIRNEWASIKRYEYSEILECMDDFMQYIDNHP